VGVAQYPTLLPGTRLTLANGSAPHATLSSLVAIFVLAAVLVGPSFIFLFSLQGRRLLESENTGSASP
jgi:cytochrome bd-type quinol oxidase subunit 2